MTTPRKKSASRAEAGLVEEDFEQKPQDETIASGEAFSEEALEGEFVESVPSALKVSGMSEEEQSMEMTPVVVGPPAYGSPDPITAAGRLLPLTDHPFSPDNLPEDHPARIDADYGKGYDSALSADEIGGQFPGAPGRTDLEAALVGEGAATEEAPDYGSQTKDELLAEAQARGLDVTASNTKAEIVAALEADDAA